MATVSELSELTAAILASPPRCGPVRVIAVDGGAAAGKSSLAAQLAAALPASSVLHTDDLLDGWAGQFGFWGRLREQVLQPLATGQPAGYRRYDWRAGRFAEEVSLGPPETLIVEGVSAIAACAELLSLAIFLDAGRDLRLARWTARDGPVQPAWLHWLDAEDAFFAEHPPGPATVVLAVS